MALSSLQLVKGFKVLAEHQIHNPCEIGSPEYDLWGMGFVLGLCVQGVAHDATPAEFEGYQYAQSLDILIT